MLSTDVLMRGVPGVAFWVAAGVGLDAMGWGGLTVTEVPRTTSSIFSRLS